MSAAPLAQSSQAPPNALGALGAAIAMRQGMPMQGRTPITAAPMQPQSPMMGALQAAMLQRMRGAQAQTGQSPQFAVGGL